MKRKEKERRRRKGKVGTGGGRGEEKERVTGTGYYGWKGVRRKVWLRKSQARACRRERLFGRSGGKLLRWVDLKWEGWDGCCSGRARDWWEKSLRRITKESERVERVGRVGLGV